MNGQEIAAYFAGIATALVCGFFGFRLRSLYEREITGTAEEPAPPEVPEEVARHFSGDVAPHFWAPMQGPPVAVNVPGGPRHATPRSYDEF